MRRAKIAIPEEFELKHIEDFLALIFNDDKETAERRIGIARTLLERLRAKRETYAEDWLEIILEYLNDQELLKHYKQLIRELEEGNRSKTSINKEMRKLLKAKGYKVYALEKDWKIVKDSLISLKIISRTSNRLNLTTDETFTDGLSRLINFYAKWRAGDIR